MPRAQQAAQSAAVPTFTLIATDPIAPGLLRFWIGAARCSGNVSAAEIKHAEATLQEFERYRAATGRKR